MKMQKARYSALLVLGLISIVIGGYILKGKWSGLLIGLGAGAVGLVISQFVAITVIERHPDLKRRNEIEQNDERNIQISNAARARAYSITQFLALPLFLVLIAGEVKLWVILVVVGAYIVQWVIYLATLFRLLKN